MKAQSAAPSLFPYRSISRCVSSLSPAVLYSVDSKGHRNGHHHPLCVSVLLVITGLLKYRVHHSVNASVRKTYPFPLHTSSSSCGRHILKYPGDMKACLLVSVWMSSEKRCSAPPFHWACLCERWSLRGRLGLWILKERFAQIWKICHCLLATFLLQNKYVSAQHVKR